MQFCFTVSVSFVDKNTHSLSPAYLPYATTYRCDLSPPLLESYRDDYSFYLGQFDTDFCAFSPREEGRVLGPDLVENANVRCQPSGHDSVEIV
jgi:hypothetical protein